MFSGLRTARNEQRRLCSGCCIVWSASGLATANPGQCCCPHICILIRTTFHFAAICTANEADAICCCDGAGCVCASAPHRLNHDSLTHIARSLKCHMSAGSCQKNQTLHQSDNLWTITCPSTAVGHYPLYHLLYIMQQIPIHGDATHPKQQQHPGCGAVAAMPPTPACSMSRLSCCATVSQAWLPTLPAAIQVKNRSFHSGRINRHTSLSPNIL